MDLLWLIILLAAVLIVEEVIFLFIILKRKHKNGKDKTTKTNVTAIPLLASIAYVSQVACIVVLCLAIVAVVVVNVYRLVKGADKDNGQNVQDEKEKEEEKEEKGVVFSHNDIFGNVDFLNAPDEEFAFADIPVSPVARHQSALFMSDYHSNDYSDDSASHHNHIHSTMSSAPKEHIKHHFLHEIVITDDFGDVTEIVHHIDKKTGLAQITKIKRSFKAKLIQSSDETKSFYSQLKNEILSYKKTKSHINWSCDEISAGGVVIAKFVVRCKTICIYFALDPDEFIDSKYKVVRSENEKFKDVPCMYCIKNDRRAQRAVELIELVAAKYGLTKYDAAKEDYYCPYESTEALTAKGLIKEVTEQENYEEFMRKKSCSDVFEDGSEDEI